MYFIEIKSRDGQTERLKDSYSNASIASAARNVVLRFWGLKPGDTIEIVWEDQ